MGNELPEEITNAIKTEANKLYWETHKASISRDPYCRGLTMFEVAQVPMINALTAKEVKYRELKDQAQAMADALEAISDHIKECQNKKIHVNEMAIALTIAQALQQFKDGKEVGERKASDELITTVEMVGVCSDKNCPYCFGTGRIKIESPTTGLINYATHYTNGGITNSC